MQDFSLFISTNFITLKLANSWFFAEPFLRCIVLVTEFDNSKMTSQFFKKHWYLQVSFNILFDLTQMHSFWFSLQTKLILQN